jgi:hypothetical protein
MPPDIGFYLDRYRKLLAEAVDEAKRLALIDLLVAERAKARLEARRSSIKNAIIPGHVTKVLGAHLRRP